MRFLNNFIPALLPPVLIIGGIVMCIYEQYVYGVYQILVGIIAYIVYFSKDKEVR